MKKFAIAAAILALAGCNRFVFEVNKPAEDQTEPLAYIYRQTGEGDLTAYVFSPSKRSGEPSAAILLFHGGGWTAGEPQWTFDAARRFASRGMVAISVQYRLSKGGLTPIEALEDTCAAFRWARRQAAPLHIDPSRVAGYGVSAGGHLVAAAATVGCPAEANTETRAEPDALLLWSPALDVSKDGWFHGLLQGRAGYAEYSPAEHVRLTTPATSIVHGALDTLTPLSGARLYCDRLIEIDGICELNVYEGVGHLLTRNLANQESDFDPDPEARAEGIARHFKFLEEQGFTATTPN